MTCGDNARPSSQMNAARFACIAKSCRLFLAVLTRMCETARRDSSRAGAMRAACAPWSVANGKNLNVVSAMHRVQINRKTMAFMRDDVAAQHTLCARASR